MKLKNFLKGINSKLGLLREGWRRTGQWDSSYRVLFWEKGLYWVYFWGNLMNCRTHALFQSVVGNKQTNKILYPKYLRVWAGKGMKVERRKDV